MNPDAVEFQPSWLSPAPAPVQQQAEPEPEPEPVPEPVLQEPEPPQPEPELPQLEPIQQPQTISQPVAKAAKSSKKKGVNVDDLKVHDDREHLNIIFIGHVDCGK